MLNVECKYTEFKMRIIELCEIMRKNVHFSHD